MSSCREDDRGSEGDRVRSLQRRLDDAMRLINKMEARLDAQESHKPRPPKAMQKVLENGGVLRQRRRDGTIKETVLMADKQRKGISVNSRSGRVIQHIVRNI